MKQQKAYGNESISSLKGADRVRLRPAVIFGSDGLEGCEHAVFEILSNAIDEAREGYGKQILVTRFADHSIEVEDFGRGCPVDWNEKRGPVQLGARLLRALRGRQISEQYRRRLRILPWPQRPRLLRHAVFVRILRRHYPPRRL